MIHREGLPTRAGFGLTWSFGEARGQLGSAAWPGDYLVRRTVAWGRHRCLGWVKRFGGGQSWKRSVLGGRSRK
jgi:hypothetical protein